MVCGDVQNAVKKVENWADERGFHFSVAKTQVICFTKRKTNLITNIKMYEQQLWNKCQ